MAIITFSEINALFMGLGCKRNLLFVMDLKFAIPTEAVVPAQPPKIIQLYRYNASSVYETVCDFYQAARIIPSQNDITNTW